MKIGNWDIYIGFLYFRLPADWRDLDEAFERGRPSWNMIGVHLWHDSTDEVRMLEIHLSRKYGARVTYSHLPAFWIAMACNCDECKRLRRKKKLKTMRRN
ncbi:MAG: hypothetical protein ACLP5V_14890 [Candidatus Bathyarchaeia archaeon]